MRIRKGFFSLEKGIDYRAADTLYETRRDTDSLRISTLRHEGFMGDRLGGSILDLEISTPGSGIIAFRMTRKRGSIPSAVRIFDLPRGPFESAENDEGIAFRADGVLATFRRDPFALEISAADGTKLAGTAESGIGFGTSAAIGEFINLRFNIEPGELFYGLGERFSPFIRNGQSVELRNEDEATSSDKTYKNIPFIVSSRGYGLFINDAGRISMEIATEDNSVLSIVAPGREVELCFIHGPSVKDAVARYARLTGLPKHVPAWSFGLWLTTSFTTHYDEKTVLEQVDRMFREGIPVSVFHFDCFWMRERHWCDFQWDTRAFPNPEKMIDSLRQRGTRVCVWINPYISELSSIFPEGSGNGFFLKRQDGSVYQAESWQPGMAYVDFTNPKAREWYKDKLRPLLAMGVDTFKTDFGECIPEDAVYHDHRPAGSMRNLYTLLYNQTVYELLVEVKGEENALVFARSATAGSQAYPVHWGGDSSADYRSMAAGLRGGLSFSFSGGLFWSHDIGGFFGTPTPDLYKRWVAFGLLSSHSRLHGNSGSRVPWNFDEESVAVLRHFAVLRKSISGYLEECAAGIPVMRPMLMEFPDDPTCRYLDRQYMLGPALLVAPIFNDRGEAEYYLPPGFWTDWWTGKIREGEKWFRESTDYFSPPLFVREGFEHVLTKE
ncbi:MAG: alpha-xylosidase [Rectinemataceae bacterium]|nr:alpha-xylosidase [Rectinemataceae bacterium]